MKNNLFILLVLIFGITTIHATDAIIRLNSADGSTRFEVQDSAAVRQFSVDSDGNTLVAGTLAVGAAFPNRIELWSDTGDMRVGGGDLQIGGSWDRRIYDDPTHACIGISTHAYVAGTHRCAGRIFADGGITVASGQTLIIPSGALSDSSVLSADIADGTIDTVDIGDRKVSSAKLLISTAQVYGNDWAGTATWNTYESQGVNVTAAPAVIIAMVSAVGNAWEDTTSKYRITIGGVQVVANQYKPDTGQATNTPAGDWPIVLVGMRRVTTTGTYTIEFQGTNTAAQVGNRSLVAFWVGSP